MAEPTASAVAWGIASGIAGAALSVLVSMGLTWELWAVAACGCIVGARYAPEVGSRQAMVLFVATSLISAKTGAAVAALRFGGSADVAQLVAIATGVLFYPLVAAAASLLPEAKDAILHRLRGRADK